ncbi:protein kinase domain-containing protein [Clostridium paraputrificum]|uniref:protein kinase domain-containing protein n=1 Tax=Clostridium paraputrificum TaxID=29363 RepID=UPI003D356209
MSLIGKVIEGKYEFIQSLGIGGMGSVFLVKDLKLGTFWAIKAIEKDDNKNANTNLLAEFDVLKKLDHPALPRITDIGEDEKYIYIVMDFVDGRNLSNILKYEEILSEENVVNYAKELCDVLAYLHGQRPNPIIHKDIKPANIMLTKEGRIKLIDFGIAKEDNKEWDDSLLLATSGYVSPEIVEDVRNISQQSDIYSLGATMYHLLTGIKPKKNQIPLPLLKSINKNVSEGMEYIVAKATQVDLSLRYKNAEEFKIDLLNINKIGKEYENKVKSKRKKIVLAFAIFCISFLITIGGWKGYSKSLQKNFDIYINNGIEARNNMNYKEALKEFEGAQKYLSYEKEGYYEIAKTYLVMGSNDECIRYLNNLMDRKKSLKNDENMNYLLGKAYLYKVNYQKAYEYFNKIEKYENVGEDFKYLMEISKQFSSPSDIDKDKFQVALNEFESFIDKNESDKSFTLISYLALADLYTYGADILDNPFDKEISIISKAKKINSRDYGVLDKQATAYREKARNIRFSDKKEYDNNLNKALELYNECLDIQVSIDVYLNIGDIYVELNNYEAAKNAYTEMLEINKDDYLGNLKLSSLYYTTGDLKNAMEYLSKTEDCDNLRPNDPQYLYLKKNLE